MDVVSVTSPVGFWTRILKPKWGRCHLGFGESEADPEGGAGAEREE